MSDRSREDRPRPWKTVVIGASTGGVESLLAVLSCFPRDCPPTLIVQHITPPFLEALAERLNRNCAATVRPARDGDDLVPGLVLMAPGDAEHLEIDPCFDRSRLRAGPPMTGHRPSVDALFKSAVRLCPDVVGVILTGMGRDGAEGISAIRRAGGVTIGQDKATSTVFGMPRAAAECGAITSQLPIDRIGPAILSSARCNHEGPANA